MIFNENNEWKGMQRPRGSIERPTGGTFMWTGAAQEEQTWCHTKTQLEGFTPHPTLFSCTLSLTDLRLHIWCSQSAPGSQSHVVLLSKLKSLCHWVPAAAHYFQGPQREMEIPVTWGCVCVCVCALYKVCFICFCCYQCRVPLPFICSRQSSLSCMFMTAKPNWVTECVYPCVSKHVCVGVQHTKWDITPAPISDQMERQELHQRFILILFNPQPLVFCLYMCGMKNRGKSLLLCVSVCLQPGPRAWWWVKCPGARAARRRPASRRERWRPVGWRSSAASWRTGSCAGLCCAQTSCSFTKMRKKPNHRWGFSEDCADVFNEWKLKRKKKNRLSNMWFYLKIWLDVAWE